MLVNNEHSSWYNKVGNFWFSVWDLILLLHNQSSHQPCVHQANSVEKTCKAFLATAKCTTSLVDLNLWFLAFWTAYQWQHWYCVELWKVRIDQGSGSKRRLTFLPL